MSFFIEMAWKSAAISAIALLLAVLIRSRSAADRSALMRVAVCLLLMLPIIALLMPALQVEVAAMAENIGPMALAPVSSDVMVTSGPAIESAPTIWDDPTALIVLLYLGGVAMIAGRLLAGLWTLRRWTETAEPAARPEWVAALDRATAAAGGARPVRLLVSNAGHSPLSWGWPRPVILIDRDSYDMVEDADAILAHEMAHVARGDWLTLVLARGAVALFWFNPLVWLIERAAMDQAEEAADCHAVASIDPARYAQTLLNFAQLSNGTQLPANCIVSGGLARRVKTILGGRLSNVPSGSAWTIAAIVASVGVAAPVAALQLIAPAPPMPVMSPEPIVSPVAIARVRPVVRVASLAHVPDWPDAPPAPDAPMTPETPLPPEAIAAPLPLMAPAAPVPPAPPRRLALRNGNHVAAGHHGAREWARFGEEMAEVGRVAARAAVAVTVDAEAIAVRVERQTKQAMAHSERSLHAAMSRGAAGMEHGADEMERGARKMSLESDRLRSREYRERKIAQAAARGETLTHEELIDAIGELKDGAREMVDGAAGMRRGASEMRRERME